MPDELKLFVWEGVLQDWTSGIAFAMAYTEEEARRLVREKLGYDIKNDSDEFDETPNVYYEPAAGYCYGGG